MAKITGFLEHGRQAAPRRPVAERVKDYRELELLVTPAELSEQAARCMDCGVPFCNTGCPLGNLIPDFNDLTYQGDEARALEALHTTNNFPEITGRVCPAPCEAACVLGINDDPVHIKLVERHLADHGFSQGLIKPHAASLSTDKQVAIIGSGPAGLAAAQQLRRAGHQVTVFERDERLGGLLTFGIPDFKLEKRVIEQRLAQLTAEGVRFEAGVNVGVDVSGEALLERFDAVCLCGGARVPRDLPIAGRELMGVHFAMDYLTQQNRRVAGLPVHEEPISAEGRHVVVLGGGDTGSDCVGTALRQGALSVTSLELMPRPPDEPGSATPWPLWPYKLRTSSSHEEGGERDFAVTTQRLIGEDGRLTRLVCQRIELRAGRPAPIAGTEFEVQADLLLLALGFTGPEPGGLLTQLGVELDARGNVRTDAELMTSQPGVFAAGDMQRGQSLVVWAIADGRRAARGIDRYLMGSSLLPTPGRAGVLR